MRPFPPRQFVGVKLEGRYEIVEFLGEGGFGRVYRARDLKLGIDVAVKIPGPSFLGDEVFLTRFAREIRSLLVFEHPHTVKVRDAVAYDDIPCVVMQFLEGGSLAERIPELLQCAPLERIEKSRGWLRDVAEALDFLHAQGVIHRDVKPANLLFDRHGNVFVADFGIAKLTEQALEPGQRPLTSTGMSLGTPVYMAPEAFGRKFGGWADQYSLAVTVFETLAGTPPLDPGNLFSMIRTLNVDGMPRLDSVAPEFAGTGPLIDVLAKAMSVSPAARFDSCLAFADAFGKAAAEAARRSHALHSEFSMRRDRRGVVRGLEASTTPSPEVLALVNELTELEDLSLRDTDIDDQGLSRLKPRRLKSLDLGGCVEITAAGFSHLKSCPPRERLVLRGCIQSVGSGRRRLSMSCVMASRT